MCIPLYPAGELALDKVPFWQFNGEYSKLPLGAPGSAHEDIDGKDFNPWQYPAIHEKI